MDDDHTLIQMEEEEDTAVEYEEDTALEYEEEQEDDDYEDEDEDDEDYEDEDEDEEMVMSETTERSSIVDGLVNASNECEGKKDIDVCTICFEGWTSGGDHRMCCLPCGHIYGMSCIRKWLIWCQGDGKCPQCKRLCTFKDIRVLYATRLCVADEKPHEASNANFPCTKEGFSEFQQHVSSCMDELKQRINSLEQRAEEFDSRLHFLQQRCNELMGQAAPENSR